MDSTKPIDDVRFQELAALYALDLLDEDESRELAQLTGSEPSRQRYLDALREAAAAIAVREAPVPLNPAVGERILQQIALEEAQRPFLEIRAGEGNFRPLGVPGISVNLLFRDKVTKLNTMLVRMEPGAEYPTHHHLDNEQCLVLEGELRWQHLSYKPGDFVVSGAGSTHPVITTETGALLLIIAGRSEFIE